MARTTYFFDESDSDRHKKKYHLSMEFLDKTLDHQSSPFSLLLLQPSDRSAGTGT